MKKHTTQKAIRERADYILKVGFADIQHLLACESPAYYNAGIYGWNCDYYFPGSIDGKYGCICTGYRAHGKDVPYALAKKYDRLAEEVLSSCGGRYEEAREKLQQLTTKFIREALA